MIEIKRSCNSSIRNDPEKRQITFGAFTIKITEDDAALFNVVMTYIGFTPTEMLQNLINHGTEYWAAKIGGEK